MCTRSMLKELAKCSKLQSLEIIEASVIHDSDLAEFSHGKVKSFHFDKSKLFLSGEARFVETSHQVLERHCPREGAV